MTPRKAALLLFFTALPTPLGCGGNSSTSAVPTPPSASAAPTGRPAPIASTAPATAPPPPFEGVFETVTDTPGKGCGKCPKLKSVYTFKGRRFRLDAEERNPMGAVTKNAMVFDMDAHTVTMLGVPDGVFPWRDEDAATKRAAELRPTDRREVIAGVTCRVWIDPEIPGSSRRELCIAPLGLSLTAGSPGEAYAGGGWPLREDTFLPPSYALYERTDVVRIERKPIDDSVFR